MRSVNFYFLLALAATALASNGSKQPSPSIHGNGPSSEAESSIRVSVSMALVPVSVTDTNGRNVTGLRRENFRLLDDKQARHRVFQPRRPASDDWSDFRLQPQYVG
jgi:hypothetical protein